MDSWSEKANKNETRYGPTATLDIGEKREATNTHASDRAKRGTVVLPYVKGMSDGVARRLREFWLRVFFRPSRKLATFLHEPKDRPSP